MSEESSQTELLAARLAGVTEAQAREINQFLDNRKAEAISVGELLERGYQYFIPNYQRGYRWTPEEVKTLLHDIEEASKDKKHCLQPLVLKLRDKGNDEYAVIDGQQRLTTISIILAWCNKEAGEKKDENEPPRPGIEYETRKRSKDFLEKISDIYKRNPETKINNATQNQQSATFDAKDDDELNPNNNVDFFNMYQAYATCTKYKGKEITIRENLLNHCSFILYIAGEGENEHEIFKRLNSGKIALTNAELTKALLLHDRPYKEQLEMALKWDEMMRFFENDDFWYFICTEPESEKYQQTRLDFLIELVPDKKIETKGDRYASFRAIDEENRNGTYSLTNEWEKLTKYYHIMRYWYEDAPTLSTSREQRSLYHLIGFLLKSGYATPADLLKEFNEKQKSAFRGWCLGEIKKKLSIADKSNLLKKIEELDYYDKNHYKIITNLLLLMNIATLEFNAGENSRYPFASHVREKWSLEHIHARQEEACIERLKQYKKILDSDFKCSKEWQEQYDGDKNKQKLNAEYNRTLDLLEEKYKGGGFSYENSFGNLALLPGWFNSKVNNKGYQDKRRMIMQECNDGKLAIIPICTRYAFFKYYSPDDDSNIVWDGKNASDYTEKAIGLIYKYLNPATQA